MGSSVTRRDEKSKPITSLLKAINPLRLWRGARGGDFYDLIFIALDGGQIALVIAT